MTLRKLSANGSPLQRAVNGLRFEARPGEILPLALSAGAAIYPHDGDSYEALLATADGRMSATRQAVRRASL